MLRSLHRHLDFARELELFLGRNNGGNDLSFSPSYLFWHNIPFSGISDDMHIRSARTEKIMLGSPAEVPGEGQTKKRRGRPAKVNHFYEEAGPNHFLKIIFKPTFSAHDP
ncbi:hypothetical protein QYE76_066306 [Lolium multiflorum]|uniref:Uncharacterized protein n=1 Tax=Lolium multiflorum TaxID=4521 RepID=A0AAD8SA92_LOLMU|nr:hypothetical protein QYE76_066306 [Lolium multiflorum]